MHVQRFRDLILQEFGLLLMFEKLLVLCTSSTARSLAPFVDVRVARLFVRLGAA